MKIRAAVRWGASVGALAVTATMMVGGASPATAEDSFTESFVLLDDDKSGVITVSNNGWAAPAGHVEWRADPAGSSTGDTLIVSDELKDGYGLVAHLSTGRVASTAGHDSPYYKEVSGNLPEGNKYGMWACVVKGSFSQCWDAHAVYA